MSSQAKPERGKSKTPTWKTETGIAIHQASGRRQDNRRNSRGPRGAGIRHSFATAGGHEAALENGAIEQPEPCQPRNRECARQRTGKDLRGAACENAGHITQILLKGKTKRGCSGKSVRRIARTPGRLRGPVARCQREY